MAGRTRLWPWVVAGVLALALVISPVSHDEPLPRSGSTATAAR